MIRTKKLLASAVAVSFAAIAPVGAANDSQLRAVRGTVGYEATTGAPFSRVFGSYLVTDNELAITQAASNGLLRLADSSEVALGENTTIQVGAITQAASAAAPTTMTLVAGAIRFAIKHPVGGQSNYRFVTSTSQLAVRGTVGLYATGPNGDVVTCLDCAAGDVSVTAGGQTLPLLTGQTAAISAAGVITVAATTAVVAGTTSATTAFAHAGLSVANTSSAFAPGIAGSTAAAAAGVTTTAITAGVAAAAAAGAGIAISNSNKATPAPTSTSTAVPIQASAAARAPAVLVPASLVPAGGHRGP